MVKFSKKTIKLIKTFNLYCCFLVLGLCVAMTGPTLIDLAHLVNTSINHIGVIYTARSIGFLIGSFASGVLYDRIKRKQIILTVCNFVTSISVFALPWSRELHTLSGMMAVNGIALGLINTGGNVCLLDLWGKDSGPFFQALHFTFGFGGLIAPLVAAPFLEYYHVDTESGNSTVDLTNETFNGSAWPPGDDFQSEPSYMSSALPTVTYAYMCIGSFTFLVALMFLFMCIAAPNEESSQKEEVVGNNIRKGSILPAVLILLTAILILMSLGTEVGYAQMLTTYATKGHLQLSTVTGSYMTSAYWASFSVSRLAAIFAAIKMTNSMMVILDVLLTVIGSLVLLILAPYFEWALWIASVVLGVGIASFFPSVIGWLNEFIHVKDRILSLFVVVASLGELLIPFTIGYFIDDYPDVFLYVVFGSCFIAVFVALVMYVILRKLPDRFTFEEKTSNVSANELSKLQ